ncbi:DUF5682 family protein [Ectothiorhodospira shaposhnikovii]|uniref:DUF5682 family protein n=1 Tax=Ectothiorhodospira shaposhnikovii TaxID=1054 RepID=UPI0019065154
MAANTSDPRVVLPAPADLLAPLPDLRLVPIRHHSPRCARHLRAVMRTFRPTHVLIEGPAELNALMPALQHAQARPPLAAYLHATVTPHGASTSDETWRCRCYVPFASFSPEWVALREAGRQGCVARFIDQPYSARLTEAGWLDHFATAPEPTLAEEPARQAPDVLAGLIAAGACRDFDEWWDRHFESGAMAGASEDYFAAVMAFGLLLRERDGDMDGEGDAGNAAREAHMAAEVRAALAQGGRCLVVCGGYHVSGILAGLDTGSSGVGPRAPSATSPPSPSPEMVSTLVDEAGVHLIPYTLDRLERASGYAAGMPSPGYYQAVWRAWEAGATHPDGDAWPRLAARMTALLRDHGMPATLPDAAEALRLAHGLAALRGCHGGRSELSEALGSALLKDKGAEGVFDRCRQQLFAGNTHGHLPPNAPVSPLLLDVQTFCARHRLPLQPAAPQTRTLDRYRRARQRQCSQGLHRLRFLGVPYATLEAGPDFVTGTDLTRVREIWRVKWEVETVVVLTEALRYGASLEEAAANRLLEQLGQGAAFQPAQRVLDVLVMGLERVAAPVLDAVDAWLDRSHDPLALAQACGHLAQAYEARHALGAVGWERLSPMLARCFAQACLRLPWLGQGDEARQHDAVDALADLNGMVRRAAPWADARAFHEACAVLHEADASARVRGATAGILGMSGCWDTRDNEAALRHMLALAETDPVQMGEYLQGFLRLGRGWLLSHHPSLKMLSDGVACWSEEAFLSGLPALRLAFAQLTRAELKQLATCLTGAPDAAGTRLPLPSDITLEHSRALAGKVAAILEPWGLA